MKINIFTTILSIALSGIIAFFLSYYVSEENKTILGIGSLVTLVITLIGTVSVSFDYNRTTTLIKTTSGIFFFLLLTCQIIFSAIDSFSLPFYILITGGLTILYVLIVYGLSRSKH